MNSELCKFYGGKMIQSGNDQQTVVIQFYKSDKPYVMDIIKSFMPLSCSAVVDVNNWIHMNVYVDLNYNPMNRPAKTYVRVAFEILDNNPVPSPINGRFKDVPIIRFEHGISTTMRGKLHE